MTDKKIAIPIDVYNKDGELVKIEFNDRSGGHVIDAHWDPREEQTSENRIAFREWAYRMIDQQGYKVQRWKNY